MNNVIQSNHTIHHDHSPALSPREIAIAEYEATEKREVTRDEILAMPATFYERRALTHHSQTNVGTYLSICQKLSNPNSPLSLGTNFKKAAKVGLIETMLTGRFTGRRASQIPKEGARNPFILLDLDDVSHKGEVGMGAALTLAEKMRELKGVVMCELSSRGKGLHLIIAAFPQWNTHDEYKLVFRRAVHALEIDWEFTHNDYTDMFADNPFVNHNDAAAAHVGRMSLPCYIHPSRIGEQLVPDVVQMINVEDLSIPTTQEQEEIDKRNAELAAKIGAGNQTHTERGTKNPLTLDMAREMLESLPNEYCDDRELWLRVCFALASEFGASAEGIALEWSQKSAHHVPRNWHSEWKGCLRGSSGANRITIGTLFEYVRQNSPLLFDDLRRRGWSPPAPGESSTPIQLQPK